MSTKCLYVDPCSAGSSQGTSKGGGIGGSSLTRDSLRRTLAADSGVLTRHRLKAIPWSISWPLEPNGSGNDEFFFASYDILLWDVLGATRDMRLVMQPAPQILSHVPPANLFDISSFRTTRHRSSHNSYDIKVLDLWIPLEELKDDIKLPVLGTCMESHNSYLMCLLDIHIHSMWLNVALRGSTFNQWSRLLDVCFWHDDLGFQEGVRIFSPGRWLGSSGFQVSFDKSHDIRDQYK